MMGAGKSTIGRVLAERTGLKFTDLDKLIEEKHKLSIPEIFRRFGEKEFRKFETEALLSFATGQELVISTGGGIVENKENIETMKKIGRIFYLYAPHSLLYERIKNDKGRPLLMTENPKKTIEEILKRRAVKYEEADYKIETANKNAEKIAEEIEKIYEQINCKIK